jgi:hypothetical protein
MGAILRHFLDQTLPETLAVATFLTLKTRSLSELTSSEQILEFLSS